MKELPLLAGLLRAGNTNIGLQNMGDFRLFFKAE